LQLLSLNIEGYRSLKNIAWHPGKLNVLIGPNGSGKSNLIKALSLMAEACKGKLYETLVNTGGVYPLLWDGQVDTIKWNIELVSDNISLDYGFSLKYRLKSGTYFIEKETLKNKSEKKELLPSELLELNKKVPVDLPSSLYSSEYGSGKYSFTETIYSQMSPVEDQAFRLFRRWINEITLYHDMPVGENAPVRRSSLLRVEKKVSSDGQNLIPVLHTLYSSNRDFKSDIDMAMNAAFDSEFVELVFPPAEDQRIQLKIIWKSMKRPQGMADLSDGTIKYLLLLAILANPEPPAMIIIDEPENGLHPAMLPVIAEYADAASEKTQIVLSTHSAELLNCLGEFNPTVTVFKNESGETNLKNCDGAELERWLQKYTLGKLFLSGNLEELL
jgi:predicted ATPase